MLNMVRIRQEDKTDGEGDTQARSNDQCIGHWAGRTPIVFGIGGRITLIWTLEILGLVGWMSPRSNDLDEICLPS